MKVNNKRLIICCDGTWNEPDKNPTNVIKLVRSIKPVTNSGQHQVVFYDQGVGTQGYTDRLIGGAFGKGVAKNVLDAYRFIVHNFEQGDEIYCYGFSRGAYTARALGGLLGTVGLISKDRLDELTALYKYYRTPPHQRIKNQYAETVRPDITLMAVWDTVGALGAPTPILGRLTKPWVGFFDTHLSPKIKNAYHALAIDEKRAPFLPNLWTGNINNDQSVEQVWFAGVHSDIGGGYPESGLSDIPLVWMIEKSKNLGLEFDEGFLQDPEFLNPSIAAVAHESHSTAYKFLEKLGSGSGVRQLAGDPNNPPVNVFLHETVLQKMQEDKNYQPQNVDRNLQVARGSDKRKQVRQNLDSTIGTVEVNGTSGSCEVLDFSPVGGARIKTDVGINKSEPVVVSCAQFAKTIATCVWEKEDTYGLKFAV